MLWIFIKKLKPIWIGFGIAFLIGAYIGLGLFLCDTFVVQAPIIFVCLVLGPIVLGVTFVTLRSSGFFDWVTKCWQEAKIETQHKNITYDTEYHVGQPPGYIQPHITRVLEQGNHHCITEYTPPVQELPSEKSKDQKIEKVVDTTLPIKSSRIRLRE